MESLKFEKGKFILSEVSDAKLRSILHHNAYWETLPEDCYSTNNLGAAAKFRPYADEKVEKIFRRSFQTHYKMPELPPSLSALLDPHQMEGLKWVLQRKRSYLAHVAGAGKTVVAYLAARFAEGHGPSVFVVPPQLVGNWQRELLKFSAWLDEWNTIGIVRNSKLQETVAWRADFVVVPDSMLTKDWVYEKLTSIKWKVVVVDEASRFKEPLAERSLAFYGGRSEHKFYQGFFRDARHTIFLDGSPAPTRAMDLWAPTYALCPEAIDCKGYDDFGHRYCGARPNDRGQWEYKFSSNEAELKGKLQQDFMHVVTEKELIRPERRRSMLFMNSDVRTPEMKEWEKKNISLLNLHDRINENVFSEYDQLAKYRRELGLRKVDWIAKYTKQRLEKRESILLFVWHREVAEKLSKIFGTEIPHGLIIGGITEMNRQILFEEFQNGNRKLIIGNILAMGRGLNLQRADRIIFGEFSWSNETNKQAEHRAARRGNEKEFIRSEYIVCPNSIDEIVLKSVFRKESMGEKLIG